MSDNRFMRDLEQEIEAELKLVESSSPADEYAVPAAEWQFDPTDIQREQAGLRNLLGAVEAVEGDVGEAPTGES